MIIEYINRYRDYRPDFSNGNTNHLPMSLFAMYKLGGTKEELDIFSKKYYKEQKFLKLRIPTININKGNWEKYLGIREHFEAYQIFFKKEVERLGNEACTKYYFNKLSKGVASEAFHCFIKLAYAIESNNNEELIKSLSYLSATIFSVPVYSCSILSGIKRTDEIIENLEKSIFYKTKSFQGVNISQRIDEVFQDEFFLNYIKIPDFSIINNITYLRNSVLKLHLIKWNFTSLHLVTSLHALRLLEKYVEKPTLIYQNYWISVLASMVTINDIKTADKTAKLCYSTDDWNEIHKRAISTMDDHIIKLVYSCHEEYKITGNYLYQIVASKSVE